MQLPEAIVRRGAEMTLARKLERLNAARRALALAEHNARMLAGVATASAIDAEIGRVSREFEELASLTGPALRQKCEGVASAWSKLGVSACG